MYVNTKHTVTVLHERRENLLLLFVCFRSLVCLHDACQQKTGEPAGLKALMQNEFSTLDLVEKAIRYQGYLKSINVENKVRLKCHNCSFEITCDLTNKVHAI